MFLNNILGAIYIIHLRTPLTLRRPMFSFWHPHHGSQQTVNQVLGNLTHTS